MNYWVVSLMDCQIKITDNKAVWKIQAALALIFLLNPFLGVLSTLFFVFVSKEKSMAFYLVIILTLFMWCLQSTRSFHLGEPSDLAGNYYYNFHLLPFINFGTIFKLTPVSLLLLCAYLLL